MSLYTHSDLCYFSWIPVEQLLNTNDSKMYLNFQRTAYLPLCLQPTTKTLGFNFLVNLMLCWCIHMFGKGQKPVGLKGEEPTLVPFVMSLL